MANVVNGGGRTRLCITVLVVLLGSHCVADTPASDEREAPDSNADSSNGAESMGVRHPSIDHDSTGYSEMHPLDIPDDAGFYIYSHDGLRALRLYGSFRMLYVFDDKDNFHAYDLVPPKLPAGNDDFENLNSELTVNLSRLGMDVLVGGSTQGNPYSNPFLIRIETDWKGDSEKFRLRHLFMKNKHWLVGQTWSTFNNLASNQSMERYARQARAPQADR